MVYKPLALRLALIAGFRRALPVFRSMIVVAVAVGMWESPLGFPRGVGRVESRPFGFPCFPYPGISMACSCCFSSVVCGGQYDGRSQFGEISRFLSGLFMPSLPLGKPTVLRHGVNHVSGLFLKHVPGMLTSFTPRRPALSPLAAPRSETAPRRLPRSWLQSLRHARPGSRAQSPGPSPTPWP